MIRLRKGLDESPLGKYELYQNAFRISAFGNIAMGAIVVLFQAIAWSAWSNRQEPLYFATYQDGGIIPLTAQSQPFLDTGEVTNFAVKAVTRAFSISSRNWNRNLDSASVFFQQPEGWENFELVLKNSGILDEIIAKQLISNVVVNNAVVINRGIDHRNRYSWTVQIQMEFSLKSSTRVTTEQKFVDVVVSRTPTWESPTAFGITRINVY